MTLAKHPYPIRQPKALRPLEGLAVSPVSCRIDFRIRWETLDEINRQYMLDPSTLTAAEFLRKIINAGLEANSQ